MTRFAELLTEVERGQAAMPYAGSRRDEQGNVTWIEGTISTAYLDQRFGQYDTAAEMKAATESEGLRLFFDHLAAEGVIPAE